MPKKFSVERAWKFVQFLTPKVVAIAVARVVNGLFLFVAEVSLGFCLLLFFQRLQGTEATQLKWMPFLEGVSFGTFLIFFCSVVLAKGALEWVENFLGVLSEHSFRYVQRKRLTEFLFNARQLNQDEFFNLFTQHLDRSWISWACVQLLMRQAFLIVPLLISLLVIAPLLTMPLMLVLAFFVLPFRLTNRLVRRLGSGYFSEASQLSNRLMMTAKNLLLFRIHGMEEAEKKHVDGYLSNLKQSGINYGFLSGTTAAYTYLVGTSLIVVIGFVGKKVSPEVLPLILPYLYILNRMLSQTLAFLSTMPMFFYNSPSLNALTNWWAEHAHDGIRGRELYSTSARACFGKIDQPLGWKVRGLSFRFSPQSDPIFENLALDIPAGKVTAFVGESGSGKSSLLNLLLGELFPNNGSIEITNGSAQFALKECRHEVLPCLGYVGAESFLVRGTLRENLLYGVDRKVDEKDILAAARRAQCAFLFDSPNALDRMLTDQGEGLSAGQKQRLCLARALLRNPKVLILDEATSNLDEATETALVDTLIGLKGQMTMICATHRKGFLRLADQVVELKRPSVLRVARAATA